MSEKYTKPETNYIYEISSFEDFVSTDKSDYVTVRTGIIPYTIINDEIYMLLGKWGDMDIYSDFGGDCTLYSDKYRYPKVYHYKDKPPGSQQYRFGCALAEFQEETRGYLTKSLLYSLATYDNIIYRGRHDRKQLKYYNKGQYEKEEVWYLLVYMDPSILENFVSVYPTLPVGDPYKSSALVGLYPSNDIMNSNMMFSKNVMDFITFLRLQQ
jgi:hypothetical protein